MCNSSSIHSVLAPHSWTSKWMTDGIRRLLSSQASTILICANWVMLLSTAAVLTIWTQGVCPTDCRVESVTMLFEWHFSGESPYQWVTVLSHVLWHWSLKPKPLLCPLAAIYRKCQGCQDRSGRRPLICQDKPPGSHSRGVSAAPWRPRSYFPSNSLNSEPWSGYKYRERHECSSVH